MEYMNEYISMLVLIFCACVGFVIKNWVPNEKVNKFIPAILMMLGVIINLWVNAWAFTPEIVLIGMVSGLASTGAHQMITKLIEAFSNKVA